MLQPRQRRRGLRKRLSCWLAALLLLALLPILHLDDLPWATLFSEWEAPSSQHPRLLSSFLESRQVETRGLWDPPNSEGWGPCKRGAPSSSAGESLGYVQVFLEGGLNQQRMGVCDAVAVAKLLNATLVLPHFDLNPVWQDSSSFSDIYDVDHFIASLSGDLKIVKAPPRDYEWSTREYYATGFRATRIKDAPLHAKPSWYLENVLPTLKSYGLVAIAPFSHRLSFDDVPLELQRLRCKVNFEALRFVEPIVSLGDSIINRLRRVNSSGESGKFVALHLRFDKDMAAHSACDFGGGLVERVALDYYRRKVWQGRVPNSQLAVEKLRMLGKCPLTPEEAGLTLAALGFNQETHVYLATHKVYGGESRLSLLNNIFPLMHDKRSLLNDEELRSLENKASRLAALDYYVSLRSDFFFSASPGNMHNAMIGHRSYRNARKTLKADMILLARLFGNASVEWGQFRSEVWRGHRNRLGQVRLRQPKQSIYTYPAPDCMCKK